MIQAQTQTAKYWGAQFSYTDADIEQLYNHFLEVEKPQTIEQLAGHSRFALSDVGGFVRPAPLTLEVHHEDRQRVAALRQNFNLQETTAEAHVFAMLVLEFQMLVRSNRPHRPT